MGLYLFRKNKTLYCRSFCEIIHCKFWKIGAKGFARKDSEALGGNLSPILRRVCYAFQEKEMLSRESQRPVPENERARRRFLERWLRSPFETNPSLTFLAHCYWCGSLRLPFSRRRENGIKFLYKGLCYLFCSVAGVIVQGGHVGSTRQPWLGCSEKIMSLLW